MLQIQIFIPTNKPIQDRTDSETARTADEGFLSDLTDKCQAKAEAWDARSKVRPLLSAFSAGTISSYLCISHFSYFRLIVP